MARKSDIRARARAGLDSLIAASNTTDEKAAGRHLQDALVALTEAAGLAPVGKGTKSLREAGERRSSVSSRLLERMGMDADGIPLVEADRLAPLKDANLFERLGLERPAGEV